MAWTLNLRTVDGIDRTITPETRDEARHFIKHHVGEHASASCATFVSTDGIAVVEVLAGDVEALNPTPEELAALPCWECRGKLTRTTGDGTTYPCPICRSPQGATRVERIASLRAIADELEGYIGKPGAPDSEYRLRAASQDARKLADTWEGWPS